jgi:molybdopterin converting factor small subunit
MEMAAGFARLELVGRPALRVEAGQTVLEALQAAQVELRQPVIAVANGQAVDLSYRLQAGDIVRLIPQIAGG